MGVLGIVTFPIGIFLVFIGVVVAVDAPYLKEVLDDIEFLEKNRRIIGTIIALVGFVLMVLSSLA